MRRSPQVVALRSPRRARVFLVTIVCTTCLLSGRLSGRLSTVDRSPAPPTFRICRCGACMSADRFPDRNNLASQGQHVQRLIQSVALRRTLDLSEYGTPRGEETVSVPDLSLPPALVELELILPRLSDPGNYFVMVAPDKSGQNRIACAKAVAAGNRPAMLLTVTLDLRSAKPGKYILSTEREGEGGP